MLCTGMVRRGYFSAIVAASGLLAAAHPARAAEPWDRPGWNVTFHDEFDGSSVDSSTWVRRYKWGEKVVNGERQAYVDDAFRVKDGILTILGTNRPGEYGGEKLAYRSGLLCSVHEQLYGYFEARLKMPKGQGFWPAFWLLGKKGSEGVNEIDVQEFLGHDVHTIYETVHWGQGYGAGHHSDSRKVAGPDYTADYHVFGLEWDAENVIWTIDGVEQLHHTGVGVPHVELYVILNLAVGGDWPKAPDKTTRFPGEYAIDYVRAYAKAVPVPAASAASTAPASSVEAAPSAAPSPAPSAGPGPASAPSAAPRSGGCACEAPRSRAGRSGLGGLLALALLSIRRRVIA